MSAILDIRHSTRNRLLASLPASERLEIRTHFRTLSLTKGATLFEPGGPVDGVYFPESGLISIVTPLRDGHTLETAIVGTEGCVGVIECRGSRTAFSHSLCQMELTGLFLPVERLSNHGGNWPELLSALNCVNETLLAQAQQSAACHGQHKAEARLCRWLLTASDRAGVRDLHLTQQFMGDMLGVQRTTVTLVATQLQAKGWIRYTRGNVRILDREAMISHACECYGAIRRHEARVWGAGSNSR